MNPHDANTPPRILYTSRLNPNGAILQAQAQDGFTWRTVDTLADLRYEGGESAKLLVVDRHLMATGDPLTLREIAALWGSSGVLVCSYPEGEDAPADVPEDLLWGYLREPYHARGFSKLVDNAFQFILNRLETERSRQELREYAVKLQELNAIGIALSSERDPDKLLDLILKKSRDIVYADAGSLYLVERKDANGPKLRFKLSQNDTFPFAYQEFTMPISRQSLAGYVALTGHALNLEDVYHLPEGAEYAFDRTFDRRTGYRTKSMLVIPMRNRSNETIGILQLINRKRRRDTLLDEPHLMEREVIPFDPLHEELVLSLASQAAVAIENNSLYQDIEGLFEGFVNASVTAIESRDPTTSGHSARVANLTVALAELVDGLDHGPFRDVHFSRDQIREVRYASLLHDFGKVGVREEVLVKAKKLYPLKLELIQSRFHFVRQALETRDSRSRLDYVLAKGREAYLSELPRFDATLAHELAALDEYLRIILEANEPTVLEEGSFLRLMEIAQHTYRDLYGSEQPLLLPDEVRQLSIRRGSLDESERREIERHVSHTYRFLSQIPWTSDLARVPDIAYAHHEKLNGKGYPQALADEGIPVQSKMMAIADIFDALTASDRPYKKAVPLERALDILHFEAKDHHIDAQLLDLFIDYRIFEQGRIIHPA
ncbi:GAF domain-containing protein [bacterium]|nr:GAF domain-containing protein [bacterium]